MANRNATIYRSVPWIAVIRVNTFPQVGLIGSGFLPATFGPFHVNTESDVSALAPAAEERKEFQRRWELLKRFDGRLRNDPSLEKKAFRDYHNHYEGAVSLMSDPRSAGIFNVSQQDHKRYGGLNSNWPAMK